MYDDIVNVPMRRNDTDAVLEALAAGFLANAEVGDVKSASICARAFNQIEEELSRGYKE